jgi:hypothetical protein
MGNAMNTIDEQFARVTDTPAERWKKAMNTISNAGTALGTALLPVVERVIGRVTEIADRIAAIDFSQYSTQIESVFSKIEGLVSGFINLIKFAWQFRYVIAAILGPIIAYNLLLMAAIPIIGLFTKLSLIAAITMGTQATALGMLKKGTIEYLIVDKLFTAATAIRNFVLNLLTGGTLAQTAATAKMAVATGTATKGQWLLNAAMTANPIGLVIGIILVLILVLKELFSNWDNIAKAFQDGGILAGILRIGGTIVSAILAPIQALLELLSKIPGLGDLAGKGADKIQEFRNFLKGTNDIANTAQNRKANEKSPASEIEELMKQFDTVIPTTGDYQQQLDALDMPSFGMPDASKLHGVVDISKGPSAITHYYAALPGAGAGPVQAIAAPPLTQTVTSAVSTPAAVDNTPQALLSINRTTQAVTALIQNIDATATAILNKAAPAITVDLSTLRIPAQATRTPYKPPTVPQRYFKTDEREQEDTDHEDPRHIAPVSREERMAYSLQERRESLDIEVSAAQGSQARIVRRPKSPNIKLTTSGGNA